LFIYHRTRAEDWNTSSRYHNQPQIEWSNRAQRVDIIQSIPANLLESNCSKQS